MNCCVRCEHRDHVSTSISFPTCFTWVVQNSAVLWERRLLPMKNGYSLGPDDVSHCTSLTQPSCRFHEILRCDITENRVISLLFVKKVRTTSLAEKRGCPWPGQGPPWIVKPEVATWVRNMTFTFLHPFQVSFQTTLPMWLRLQKMGTKVNCTKLWVSVAYWRPKFHWFFQWHHDSTCTTCGLRSASKSMQQTHLRRLPRQYKNFVSLRHHQTTARGPRKSEASLHSTLIYKPARSRVWTVVSRRDMDLSESIRVLLMERPAGKETHFRPPASRRCRLLFIGALSFGIPKRDSVCCLFAKMNFSWMQQKQVEQQRTDWEICFFGRAGVVQENVPHTRTSLQRSTKMPLVIVQAISEVTHRPYFQTSFAWKRCTNVHNREGIGLLQSVPNWRPSKLSCRVQKNDRKFFIEALSNGTQRTETKILICRK